MLSFSLTNLAASIKHRRWLVMLVLVCQCGFVSAEPLWLPLVEIEHQHMFEQVEDDSLLVSGGHSGDSLSHCDICHGYGSHLAVLPWMNAVPPILFLVDVKLPALSFYTSFPPPSIYRPPINAV